MFPLFALGLATLFMLGTKPAAPRVLLLERGRLYTVTGVFPGLQQVAVAGITALGGIVGEAKQQGQTTRVVFQWVPPADVAVKVPGELEPFGINITSVKEVEPA